MTKTWLLRAAIMLGAVIVVSPAVLASPITDADLRGKTICWSYGGTRNTYGSDGSLDSNLLGHGTWSLRGDTLTEHGGPGDFTFTITKEGQTFHKTGATFVSLPVYGNSPGPPETHGHTMFVDVWGSYCHK
jgi:hypothetical protein